MTIPLLLCDDFFGYRTITTTEYVFFTIGALIFVSCLMKYYTFLSKKQFSESSVTIKINTLPIENMINTPKLKYKTLSFVVIFLLIVLMFCVPSEDLIIGYYNRY